MPQNQMRKVRTQLRVGADADQLAPPHADVAAHPTANKVKEDNMSAIIDVHTVAGNRSQTSATSLQATSSPKRVARIAGGLYLVLAIFGGFAQGYVYPKLFGAGNAPSTGRDLTATSEPL